MLISGIVPVYNARPFLERFIQSLEEQTYPQFEVIFVDNGSIDGSKEYLKQFVSSRIKLYEERKNGANCARKLGFQYAEGDYVYFADADDYLAPNTLEVFANTIEKTNADILISDFIFETDGIAYYKKGVGNISKEQWIYDKTEFINAFGALWNKLLKRSLVKTSDFINTNCGEDVNLWIKLMSRTDQIYYINQPLYYYQKNMGSLTNQSVIKTHTLYGLYQSMDDLHDYYDSEDDYQEEIDYLLIDHLLKFTIKATDIDNQNIREELLSYYQELLEQLNYQENNYFKKDKLLRMIDFVFQREVLYKQLCRRNVKTLTKKCMAKYQKRKRKSL